MYTIGKNIGFHVLTEINDIILNEYKNKQSNNKIC